MKTLYDLLGALPSDEAEGLRTAFRKAVKGAHPDIHPGDPDAGLKFREIVRANEILGDAGQRTAYDHLLALARLEQEPASEQAIAARIHKLASGVIAGVIALAGVSVVTVGGYLLFTHMSAALVAPANEVDVTARGSAEIARVSPAESPDTTNKSASAVNTRRLAISWSANRWPSPMEKPGRSRTFGLMNCTVCGFRSETTMESGPSQRYGSLMETCSPIDGVSRLSRLAAPGSPFGLSPLSA